MEAAEQEDYDLAQAILSGANISLPTGGQDFTWDTLNKCLGGFCYLLHSLGYGFLLWVKTFVFCRQFMKIFSCKTNLLCSMLHKVLELGRVQCCNYGSDKICHFFGIVFGGLLPFHN